MKACAACDRGCKKISRGMCGTCYERARRAGVFPGRVEPLDSVVVERLVAGERCDTARPIEVSAAVQRLVGYGMTSEAIAARVGCSARTVQRHRSKIRKAA